MYKKFFLLFLLLNFLFAFQSFADRRFYVWTYEYKTVEKGWAEVESYFTLSTPDKEKIKGNMSSEHQIELEAGMTEKFDFSVYQVFEQKAQENFKYKGFKLRFRYKIGGKGKYFMDPLLYFEYNFGPVISHGKENLWVALGSAFSYGKIKEGKPEFQIRLLMGYGFQTNPYAYNK